MEQVTVSPNGQIAIPKPILDALNLTEGSRLTLEVRGHEIVLSKGATWRNLRGAGGDRLVEEFAAFKVRERVREDSRP